jgi:proteasome lid subunit RPN8/RPN11
MQLDRVFFEEMVEHGMSGFPNEACGLLAGKEGRPVRFFPMRNSDASPVTYRLDPMEQLEVFDEMDDQGWELLGIFHTHTHSQAFPSETDRQQAFYPEASYLVMSLADRSNPILRSFRIDEENGVAEEELVIS